VTENFTGATTNCSWYFINGACLTAGSTTTTTSPGLVPSCAALSAAGQYYNGVTLVGGDTGTLPDTVAKGGALRLTNDTDTENGAIISAVPFSLASTGLQVTFTTEAYEGDSGGANGDGADGISFFLQDASAPSVTLGDWGGSLGYTCSNVNDSATQGYDGMVGGYIGLGIDEYGNFLNGTEITNTSGAPTFSAGADNTSSGYGYVPNRVGLRGAGSTAWSYLSTNATTSSYYPLTLTAAQQQAAVRQACQTGYVWNYTHVTPFTVANGGLTTNGEPNPYNATPVTTVTLPNYAAIPNANAVLTHLIANEAATKRGYATTTTTGANFGIPITYNLSISPAGLLSLSYSYDGGNFQPIITGQNITTSNGPLPASVRFGFAGSTGGSRNIHEIMCFQAQPQNSASSSAGLNQKQTAKVQTGTQVYFAFYNSSNWTGSLTSQYLVYPTGNPAGLYIDPNVNWDASCVLTGVPTGQTCATTGVAGPITAEDPDAGRIIWGYNSSAPVGNPTGGGVAFTWSAAGATPLSANEQTNLNFGVSPAPPSGSEKNNSLLEYLRGVRADEQTAFGYGLYTPTVNPSGFRARTSVLGDIVDSSPTWVGPPSASFPVSWTDKLYPAETLQENSGPNYASFETAYNGRMNIVYAGANDGFLHGFRSGYFNNGTYVGTTVGTTFTATDNDGQEVLAFMPGYVANAINSATVAGSSPATPNYVLDYSSPLYAHKFNVDGTPGTGDLHYGGAWHTWLVGGLGAGGNAIYALDITDPTQFTQANAGTGVIGEWSSSNTTVSTTSGTGVVTTTVTGWTSNFTCSGNIHCGANLGKTFGTPQIRRFHNNPAVGGPTTSWGAVFGNGSGSFSGDAGIFVLLANNSGQPTLYYLSTGVGSNYSENYTSGVITHTAGNANGIYYVSPADLDGDHVTDYVYAGDMQGNIWRFDLTSPNPANWAVTAANGIAATSLPGTPIYSTGSSSIPITTQLIVASVPGNPNPRVMIEFGTGQQTPFTNNAAATYATAQQYLMGVWDWNFSGDSASATPVAGAWNTLSSTKYASLPYAGTAAPASALSSTTNLLAQSIEGTFSSSYAASSTSSTSSSDFFFRTVSNSTVCWPGSSPSCTPAQYGWYLPLSTGYPNSYDPAGLLPTTGTGAAEIYEQVIFNPTLQDGAFIVNTTIPPTTSLAQCSSTPASGWTMVLNPATGGAFTQSVFTSSTTGAFQTVNNQAISGIAWSGTGTPSLVTTGSGSSGTTGTYTFLATQTVSGTGQLGQVNLPGATSGSRLTWIQRR
jgi:type IV pilus assembly protein PilY1